MSNNEKQSASSPAWQRAAGKNPEGGLNAKGRASYKRETGGTLKAPVTESNPKGDRAKRQNSFCSRMCGMKRVNTGSKTKKDPDSRINKSLRKWNCKCSNAREFGEKIAQRPCVGPNCNVPQYSKTPWTREYATAAFDQHKIPYNPNATDQQLYNLYTRKGQYKPGAKPNPFQAMVGAHHGYLLPPPLQPKISPGMVKTQAAQKTAEAPTRDPLLMGLLSAAAGGVVGGFNAPKGELLKYMLGGAGVGGSMGVLAGTGRNLGAHTANALVKNQGLTGNSAVAAELGLPIAGGLGGIALSLPIVKRINEEFAHNPQKNKNEDEKTAGQLSASGLLALYYMMSESKTAALHETQPADVE